MQCEVHGYLRNKQTYSLSFQTGAVRTKTFLFTGISDFDGTDRGIPNAIHIFQYSKFFFRLFKIMNDNFLWYRQKKTEKKL